MREADSYQGITAKLGFYLMKPITSSSGSGVITELIVKMNVLSKSLLKRQHFCEQSQHGLLRWSHVTMFL